MKRELGIARWIPIDWFILTVVLINTEEKWLLKVYGDEYAEYKKRVNRCIPWFPKQKRS